MVDCNMQPEQAVSNGVWQGDNPLDFALPRLVIQLFLVLLVTRSLAWLLAPLRQPRVVAEIIGGVMLGPSVLGRFHAYSRTIFPEQSLLIIDTVANMGLMFFLFMVGLELDVKELQRTGRKAFVMAMAGVGVPFMGGMAVAKLVTETISSGVRFAPLVVFMGVPISITAFPVLVRILAEHKLLTLTEIGQLVLPAAAINDVCAWILLAMGVALAGSSTSALTSAWVLLSGIAFVTFMLLITRRFMCYIIHRANSQEVVSEIYVCITLVGVLLAGFTTDAIGIHPLFGAFVFGLIIPKDGKFAEIMTQKVEDFVTVLMLPLFFASSGLKTNLGSINSWQSVGFLVLIFVTAAGGKIGATWAFAVAQGIEKRKALALGFLMNTKGLVELIVLNIGKDSKVLNDQTFAILVLMCLFTTFITTPVVMALYKPYQKAISYTARCLQDMCPGEQLRIVACIHGTQTISPILNFLEIVQSGNTKQSSKAYILHVVELCERPSCLMMAKRKAKKPGDKMFVAFETYGHLKKVTVKTKTVVSEVEHMHEDVCNVAGEKRATIIVLPFHIICGGEGDEANRAALSPLLAKLNQKVLQHAPSAVAIVADCRSSKRSSASKVGVLFMGGGHDREAIKLGCLMAEHPGTEVTIIRLLLNKEIPAEKEDLLKEWRLDEQCIVEVKQEIENKSIAYEERLSINDVMEAVGAIVETKRFDMYVVGRWSWCEEGELGEMMQEVVAQHMQSEYCVVMVQQYDRKVRDMDVKSTREPTYNSMA